MFCPNCGSIIKIAAGVCGNCGERPVELGDQSVAAISAHSNHVVADDLASRRSRLGAVLIDWLAIPLAIYITLVVFLYFVGLILVYLWWVPWLALLLAQIFYLARDGQTFGKKAVGIAIVDRTTGRTPSIGRNIGLRLLLNGVIGIIPLYGIVDILFIFRQDQQCIHDMIARTAVVRV